MSMISIHSFDLWGPIVDATELGKRKVELYRQIAVDRNIDPEVAKKVIADYQGLIDGESWATGKRKGEIINALEGVVGKSGLPINYDGVFQEDGLYVMDEILNAGEGVIVLTSKPASWLKENLPSELGERVGEVYHGDKSDPNTFIEVIGNESAQGRHVISHTADELPELIAALGTGLFDERGLIYINRNNSNTPEQVLSRGITRYVNNLKDVGYLNLLNPTEVAQ